MNSSDRFIGWRKSSYSSGQQGECLEVADGYADIPVRDSKNPTGPTLLFRPTDWSSFIAAVKAEALTG
ncbi:DUF397 domain-containing protein [Streptomyces sp. NBC_00872]|uniref:DUF397 domain-containing protein n=1 Tax=Streptomyces sp. NBC_00872 TaxID=2903686 RepID=UPI00386B59F0|nr:DUF397 domain-containing protein [Streptomyces sp. NBC_00872]